MKKILYSRKENPLRFWIQLTAAFAILWLLMGLLGFLPFSEQGVFYLDLLAGLCPCGVLLFAVLALMEHKWHTPKLPPKAQAIENVVLILFGLLILLAEVVHAYSGEMSYDIPLTLAALAAVAIIRISAPSLAKDMPNKPSLKSKIDNWGIVKILFLGTFIILVFSNFFKIAMTVLLKLSQG